MSVITVWLLISIGGHGYHEYTPHITVAQFATSEECTRVQRVLLESTYNSWRTPTRCIQATIVKP